VVKIIFFVEFLKDYSDKYGFCTHLNSKVSGKVHLKFARMFSSVPLETPWHNIFLKLNIPASFAYISHLFSFAVPQQNLNLLKYVLSLRHRPVYLLL